ncbi:MAG: hypothetical protein ONB48_21030 [candidate division KSB1 bacterium]|nr:hypothetical protein [candidate division KSB1 bacterium]MDZ7288133.1 hypothetical protein [candidate division KSB1 bacterium]MDZ7300354.1 hypothetical protein [candidate division KSB1 bacterium]MDZ7306167.1 hypothetical protein [candidate division KSB1 bacterium]MDZ7351354.1 hypothetical protein [candidate division KSB1 bacterium]
MSNVNSFQTKQKTLTQSRREVSAAIAKQQASAPQKSHKPPGFPHALGGLGGSKIFAVTVPSPF